MVAAGMVVVASRVAGMVAASMVLAASMVAADTAQALGDRAAGTVAADTASQALADMAPGLLPLIQSEVAVSPAGATWVAGCSATAPLPTSLCDRNSGRRDSAVGSSV